MSRLMPSRLPASMVTVQEKPWAAPMAMTSAPLTPYCPAPAALSSLSSSRARVAVAVVAAELPLERDVLLLQRR